MEDGRLGVALAALALPPAPPPGIIVQGAGSSDWLQVSSDGLHWHSYRDIRPGTQPAPQVPPTRAPWTSNPPCPFVWGPQSMFPRGFLSLEGHFLL